MTELKRFIGGLRKWGVRVPFAELVIDDESVAISLMRPLRWLGPSVRLAFREIAYVEVGGGLDRGGFRFRTKAPSRGVGVTFIALGNRQAVIDYLVAVGLDVRDREA